MTFTLIYDPLNAKPTPDGKAMQRVAALVEKHKKGQDVQIVTSSHLVVDALRVLVRRGEIKAEDVIIQYRFVPEKGAEPVLQVLKLYSSGRIEDWPDGFCDHTINLLLELI